MKSASEFLGRIVLILGTSGLLSLNACTDENSQPTGLDHNRASAAFAQQGTPVYPEERPFLNLAQSVPSSAGFFRDRVTGDVVVSVTNMNEAGAAKAVLRSTLASLLARARVKDPRADVAVRLVAYTFLQLKEWRDRMLQTFAVPGVEWLDLNEETNSVELGVDPGTDLGSIRRLAREQGVPEKAVTFRVDGPAKFLSSLVDSIRPIVGALKISYGPPADSSSCTLGFTALWNGVRAFLTASHCSSNVFLLDGTQQYQPRVPVTHTDSQNIFPVGFEAADFAPATCPPGLHNALGCLYADAAVYQFTGGSNDWVLGRVAHPTFGCLPTPCNPPNLQFQGYWGITATDNNIMMNDLVSQVGITSGWDQGFVTQSCVNVKAPKPYSNYYYLCADIASYQADFGDSGSPVLLNINPPPDTTVTLGGMTCCKTSNGNAIFNPWSGILTEYPGLVVH